MSDNVNKPVEKPPKMKLAILLGLVVAVSVAGFFTYAYFTKTFVFAEKTDDGPVANQMYALNEFVLNLKDTKSKRYLKTKLALGYEHKKDAEILAESDYKIRDVIIQTLRAKTADEIMQVERTSDLKIEIMKAVNEIFEPDIVLDVYIIDFLIQ